MLPNPTTGICDMTNGSTHSYGAIGIGFGFTAVPAVLSPTTPIADGPLPGRCGSPATTTDGGC